MQSKEVFVISTGVANIASILAGLRRAGAMPQPTLDASVVANAAAVVLPGVGAFGAGMAKLREAGLVEPLVSRIEADRPTLAICLGLQLLCRASEETPGVAGLGVIDTEVRRFPSGLRVPQIGWNKVTADSGDGCLLQCGYAYFANSYRLVECPTGWMSAHTDYGASFVAAIQRGAVLACQFHPELSGSYGITLLRRWLDWADEEGERRC